MDYKSVSLLSSSVPDPGNSKPVKGCVPVTIKGCSLCL